MKIVALAGGVGGAKLAHGLALALPPQDLTIIVNVGDDFWHYGLYICPDLDTVCYNLAEINDPAMGWGRADESLAMFAELEKLGGQTWFRLGDRDLATHLERTRRLHAGQPLSVVVRDFCQVWGIQPAILPASDDWIPTIVHTDQGQLAFQDYFVARRCEPKVTGFHFQNVEKAAPAPGVLDSIQAADAVIICPSNPWVSIDPILAIPGIRPALADKLILAVSPLIAGQALKGPAAKMYAELGIQPTAAAVAAHYQSFLKVFVLDQADAHLADIIAVENFTAPTWMKSKEERLRLAELIINRIRQIRDSAD